ncbi:MAG: substrate-binding domain-containing protein [Defluviitaleaceae bacterium]|nr:substrate-binding domain-containing protein [Defluviitaleaceae bacterium]
MGAVQYYKTAFFMTFIVVPFVVNICAVIVFFTAGFGIVIPVVSVPVLWRAYLYGMARRGYLPEKLSQVLLPVFAAFFYYIMVWIVFFGWNGFSPLSMQRASDGLLYFTLPYFFITFFLNLMWDWVGLPILYGAVAVVLFVTTLVVWWLQMRSFRVDILLLGCVAFVVLLSGISVYQFYEHNLRFLTEQPGEQRVSHEVDVRQYRPFAAGNRLTEMPWEPAVVFTEDFPRLDGATAAYPVFAAVAQALYVGLNEATVVDYVSVSGTDMAYQRLIDGEIDIFFGAQPSEQQVEAARARGVEFIKTPVAREAFVFFVHRENPVYNLSVAAIQDVYRRRVTNWWQLGGNDERILAFQRPDNSGSQTIMLSAVMGDIPIARPLREEWNAGMGEIISRTAEYRNYSSAIGYSFRYFVTGMRPHDDIKILSIGGVSPTPENIRNGTYPFTVNIYAVTTSLCDSKNAEKLIQWLLSEQGQAFIELCGVVGIK